MVLSQLIQLVTCFRTGTSYEHGNKAVVREGAVFDDPVCRPIWVGARPAGKVYAVLAAVNIDILHRNTVDTLKADGFCPNR